MKSDISVSAGTNESAFKALMGQAGVELQGKRRFSDGSVEISVDESFLHNGRQYYVEIDSANIAKLLVGQYVLLNELILPADTAPFFLVVHYYKTYEPMRTVKNLHFINQRLFAGAGIEFAVLHKSQLEGGFSSVDELLAMSHRASA